MAGSRFLTGAEKRYAAIEGEALAVAWGLEQTKYFTQGCPNQVDFAGFRLGESSIEPLPKFIDAIRSFPTPKSTKDIRSWFGLVNQVANYGQLRDFMTLFRKPKVQILLESSA